MNITFRIYNWFSKQNDFITERESKIQRTLESRPQEMQSEMITKTYDYHLRAQKSVLDNLIFSWLLVVELVKIKLWTKNDEFFGRNNPGSFSKIFGFICFSKKAIQLFGWFFLLYYKRTVDLRYAYLKYLLKFELIFLPV